MTVLQRVMAVVLAVLGAASLGLAVASATLWRPDDVVTASLAPSGAVTMLVAEPGVLGLVGDEVTVTAARADGGPVAIVVGRDADVRGWVGADAHVQVTGLASWTELASTAVAGETTPVPEPGGDETAEAEGDAEKPFVGASGIVGPDPLGSDMWLAESGGSGTATLTLDQELGREMLLVAGTGDGAVAPTVTLSWPRTVSTPALLPGIILGVVLLVAAAVVVFLPRLPALALRLVEARNARRGAPAPVQVAPDAPHGGPIVAPTSRFAASTTARDDAAPAAVTSGAYQTGAQPQPSQTGDSAAAAQETQGAPGEPGGRPLTRRELRERAEREAAEAARDRGRKRPRTGMLPQVRSRTESAAETAASAAPGQAAAGTATSGPATPGQSGARPAAAGQGAPGGGAAPSQRPGDNNPSARADAWRAAWGFQADGPAAAAPGQATEPGPGTAPAEAPRPTHAPGAGPAWSAATPGAATSTPRPPTPQPHQQLRPGAAPTSPYGTGAPANPYLATPATATPPTWTPDDKQGAARTEEDA